MNILIITESNSKSANYNIAIRMAKEFKKNSHQIYAGYFITSDKIQSEEVFVDSFIVQNSQIQEYLILRNSLNWSNITNKKRIEYLITKKNLLRLYLKNALYEKFAYKSSSRIIENFCIEKNIDAVIGVSYPYSICQMVSNVKNVVKCGVQLDPHAYNYVLPKKQFSQRLREERKTIEKLDYLFTTDLIKNQLVENHKISKNEDKIIEIEFPEVDADIIRKKECCEKKEIIVKKEDTVSFLHAGRFYDDIRNASKLIDLFVDLPSNYVLYVAGPNTADIMKYENRISGRIVDLGYISLEEAKIACGQADVLISYNNAVSNQVPSKLFECINTGKPFINLCQLEECPSLKYVKDYEMACTVFLSENNNSKKIQEFVSKKVGTIAKRERILHLFKKCTIEYFAKLILNKIDMKLYKYSENTESVAVVDDYEN